MCQNLLKARELSLGQHCVPAWSLYAALINYLEHVDDYCVSDRRKYTDVVRDWIDRLPGNQQPPRSIQLQAELALLYLAHG